MQIKLSEIMEIESLLKDKIRRTPQIYSRSISRKINKDVYLKLENLQQNGSFKIRGSLAKLLSMSKKELDGKTIIAASAGNHAQGVAQAGKILTNKVVVVMPTNSPKIKIQATIELGAKVILFGNTFDEAMCHSLKMAKEHGYIHIHAFNDKHVILGQGTIGLEILKDLPKVKQIVIPIGGGGLISGIAIVAKTINPDIEIIGVESELVPSAKESVESGGILVTGKFGSIADGIAVKSPGDITFEIMKKYVDRFETVSESDIRKAIALLIKKVRVVAEGAGAVSIAYILANPHKIKKNTVAIISGGNIDSDLLIDIINKEREE